MDCSMRVEVQLDKAANSVKYLAAIDTYMKGDMFCVMFNTEDGRRVVHKYPISNIFRVVEDDSGSKR